MWQVVKKFLRKKSTSPPKLWGLKHITPNLWKWFFYPLNFLKRVKSPLEAILKKHNKSQKNHKMENPIVLDYKWVHLHNDHNMVCLLHFFYSYGEKHNLKLQQKICTKTFHIVCSLCRTTNLKSNTFWFFILWFFCDFVWFFITVSRGDLSCFRKFSG
jgi:hypothetical protein